MDVYTEKPELPMRNQKQTHGFYIFLPRLFSTQRVVIARTVFLIALPLGDHQPPNRIGLLFFPMLSFTFTLLWLPISTLKLLLYLPFFSVILSLGLLDIFVFASTVFSSFASFRSNFLWSFSRSSAPLSFLA
jgi:hypothetical protein